jgi:hypothetical protein
MAEGLPEVEAIALLSNLATRALFMQLHTGPPGPLGTANIATENDRKAVTWGTPVLVGAAVEMTHSNVLSWPDVAGSEDYTHASFHTLITGGTCRLTGQITASPVVALDDWSLPAGAYIVRWPVAS